jgi:hypothetical protein
MFLAVNEPHSLGLTITITLMSSYEWLERIVWNSPTRKLSRFLPFFLVEGPAAPLLPSGAT